ncbi:MAG: hypothetical protein AB1430_00065 [Pseudomonadota bacterium]
MRTNAVFRHGASPLPLWVVEQLRESLEQPLLYDLGLSDHRPGGHKREVLGAQWW